MNSQNTNNKSIWIKIKEKSSSFLKKLNKRLRSPVVITTLVTLLVVYYNQVKGANLPQDVVVSSIVSLFIAFGIINNPENKTGF